MQENRSPESRSPTGLLVLMALGAVWSGVLAVGFVLVVVAGGDEMGVGRVAVYLLLAGFLGVIAAATGVELGRRLRSRG